MKQYKGKLAVVTGAGSGIGRELAVQLVSAGADVALCDVQEDLLKQAHKQCAQIQPQRRVTAHVCDIADAAQVQAMAEAVLEQHNSPHIHLLFNNAGMGGGDSFVDGNVEHWERTFSVNWNGVYNCTRAFMPALMQCDEGAVINTSSVNGFLASQPNHMPQTAYSTAKFAVKGFTESLLSDFRVHAPHLRAVLVMPGHVGTSIVANAFKLLGMSSPDEMSEEELEHLRRVHVKHQPMLRSLSVPQLRQVLKAAIAAFKETAPMTAAQAATTILEGILDGQWRILVGDDAHLLDRAVRAMPNEIYDMPWDRMGEVDALLVIRDLLNDLNDTLSEMPPRQSDPPAA